MGRAVRSVVTLDTSGFESGINREVRGIDRLISSMKKANTSMKALSKPLKMAVDSRKALSTVKKVGSDIHRITSKTHKVTLTAVDRVSGRLSKIKSNILDLKNIAAGIIIGGAAVGAAKATIGGASNLQQEQVAMKHFIGNAKINKGKDIQKITDSFIEGLRVEANVTPFSTSEVIAAGRRAVNVVQGDTKKAMELVKLSEDMAALNPGKSVMDAMEALADMKTGEFERMKEFGFKFSQAEFKKMVGKGEKDNLTDAEMDKAYTKLVRDKLNPVFTGGAGKLSKTAAGKWSTVTGNAESIMTNLGTAMLPNVEKSLDPLIGILDKFENTKAFESLKNNLASVSNVVSDGLVTFLTDLEKHPEKIDKAFSILKDTFKGVGETFATVGAVGQEVWPLIKPILDWARENPDIAAKILVGATVGIPALKKSLDGLESMRKMLDGLKGHKDTLKDIFKGAKKYGKKAGGFVGKATKPLRKGIHHVDKNGLSFLEKPIKLTVDGFKWAGGKIGKGLKHIDTKGLTGLTSKLKFVDKAVNATRRNLSKGWGKIKAIDAKGLTGLTPKLKGLDRAVNATRRNINKGLGNLKAIGTKGIDKLKPKLKGIDKALRTTKRNVGKGLGSIKNIGTKTIDTAKVKLKGLDKALNTTRRNMKKGLGRLKTPKLNVGPTKKGFIDLGGTLKTFEKGSSKALKGAGKSFKIFKNVFKAIPIVGEVLIIIDIIDTLKTAWDENFMGIRDLTDKVWNFIESKLPGVSATFEKVKTSCSQFAEDVKVIWQGIKDFFSHPIQATVNFVKTGSIYGEGDTSVGKKGGGKSGNKKAMGQRVIPYDEYPIIAHQGETLLTANESRRYKNGSGALGSIAITGNNFYVREESDIDKIADALLVKINRARFNMT